MSKLRLSTLAVMGLAILALSFSVLPVLAHDTGGARGDPAMANSHGHGGRPARDLALHDGMRKLWEDHIVWTRLAIIGLAAGTPDTEAAVNRLLQNQTDIGDAIRPFYGNDAGDRLTALLKDHIVTAAELVTAAKAGDTAKFEDANARWYANADEIAAFLSGANPDNWPLEEMKAMMHSHLDLTLAEAVARLNADWEGEVAAYDEIHEQILEMADMLSSGISRQFPR